MKLKYKQLSDAELNLYIDKYLAGSLPEDEMDEFEARCLEDKILFEKLREREQFTQKVAKAIGKDGAEIFEDYLAGEPDKSTPRTRAGLMEKLKNFWSRIQLSKPVLTPAALSEGFRRVDSIEIIAPLNRARLAGNVQFQWKNHSKNPVEFVLLNSQGREIETKTFDVPTGTFSIKLEPGLYYWKLIDARGNVIVSKFTVAKP